LATLADALGDLVESWDRGVQAMIGTMNPLSDRAVLIRRAFLLSWLSIGWMSIEAAVAVSTGIAAGSLTLTAFGLDSGIELLSAAVLIWRLTVELRQGRHIAEKTEQTASRISGNLLFALAAYIIVGAAWGLWTQHGEAFSAFGLAVAILAMPIMFLLSRQKTGGS
jgi:divalent metal cation (Fe/Co/Zn/Cd) transporter